MSRLLVQHYGRVDIDQCCFLFTDWSSNMYASGSSRSGEVSRITSKFLAVVLVYFRTTQCLQACAVHSGSVQCARQFNLAKMSFSNENTFVHMEKCFLVDPVSMSSKYVVLLTLLSDAKFVTTYPPPISLMSGSTLHYE